MNAKTRSFQHVLIPLIVQLSEADNWAKAKYEWNYTKYDHISLYEAFACLDTQRKRVLSGRQDAKRREINKLVLARLAPVMLAEGEDKVQGGK